MAKNSQTEVRRPVMIEYLDPENPEQEISEEEIIFNKFKDEMATGENYASMTVYRQPGPLGRASRNKLVYLFECGIDEYTFPQLLSYLRDYYGTGTYRIQGRTGQERKLVFNRSVDIEGLAKPAPSPGAKDSTTDIMRAVQEMMTASQARTDALIASLTEKPDPAATLAKWTALLVPFVPVLQAMVNRPASPSPVAASLLDELAKFAKVKDLVADLGGGGGDGGGAESNFYDLAGKALETLGPVVGMAIQKGQVRLPAPPAAGTPGAGARPMPETARPATPPPPNGVANMPRQPQDPIAGQVKLLLMNAKGGQDPTAVAEMVLDNTPDEKLGDLKSFVSAPNVLDRMAAAVPEVRNYIPWFTKLRDAILSLLAEIEADNLAPAAGTSGGSGSSTEPEQAPAVTGAGTP